MGTTQENKSNWINSELFKSALTAVSLLSPLFAFIIVNLYECKSEISVLKVRVDNIQEIKTAIYNIQQDVGSIKLDLITLKTKLDLHQENNKGK